MLIDVLEEAGLDPTAIVGSLRLSACDAQAGSKTGSNFRPGKSKYFIVEACEYKRDFLSLEPDILVITNLEYEHVDYYKNLADVQDAFKTLSKKVPEGGVIIANLGDDNVTPCIEGVNVKVIDYAKFVDPLLSLKVPGLHNQMNAAAARAAAEYLGIKPLSIRKALENFAGTWRRFEYKDEVNGAKIYDDYAHHPTEIRAAIAGARELYPDKKLTVVFQSHTYSRTHELFDDFVIELAKADRILLVPIYAAREENVSGVSHHKLAEAIKKTNSNVQTLDSFDEIVIELKNTISDKDVVIVMGAGDITKVTERYLTKGLLS
jgi:UDP-N-acetylmuramate--alanine ligase